MTGLRFHAATASRALGPSANKFSPFGLVDLVSIEPRVKHTNLINNAEGIFYLTSALQKNAKEDTEELLKHAKAKFEASLVSNPNHVESLIYAALTSECLLETSLCGGETLRNLCNLKFTMNDPLCRSIDRYFQRALEVSSEDSTVLGLYAKFLSRCGRNERAELFFLRSLEVNPMSIRFLKAYGDFLMECGDRESAERVYARLQEVAAWMKARNILLS